MKPVINKYASMVPEIIRINRSEEGLTVEQIKTQLSDLGLLSGDDVNSPIIGRLIHSLTSNTQKGEDDLAEELIDGMSVVPEWGALKPKERARLRKYIETKLKHEQSRYTMPSSSDGGNDYNYAPTMPNLGEESLTSWLLRSGT
jgi:hypothetical protein